MNDLQKLFLSELKTTYDAEQQRVQALPELEQQAISEDVKRTLREHLEQTRGHLTRLQDIFSDTDEASPKGKTCHGIQGIIDEGRKVAEQFERHAADAALIAAGLKCRDFAITSYGTLCSWAEELRERRAAGLLKENLREEKAGYAHIGRLSAPKETNRQRGLRGLFVRQLREIFDGEHLLVSALAELEYYAASRLLKFAFRHHLRQTENHVSRLEKVFADTGETPDRKPCEGIEGIIDDAQVSVMEFVGNSALDAALIGGAQKAERYEITVYGILCCWAEELGLTGTLKFLQDNLSDEIATDKKLTFAAEWLRNPKAKRHESVKRSAETAEFLKLATHGE